MHNPVLLSKKRWKIEEWVRIFVEEMSLKGKKRTARAYKNTLRILFHFAEGKEIYVEDMDDDFFLLYEMYLRKSGVSPTMISFYMRHLHAIYNKIIETI